MPSSEAITAEARARKLPTWEIHHHGLDHGALVPLWFLAEAGWRGPTYICRDHGGPWQRNAELDGKFPLDRAMAIARQSFRADIEAGFNYLHIDPTKCPHSFTQENLVDWTVQLVAF